MASASVRHHRKAAQQFAYAAKHHKEASTLHGEGRHERAAREAYLAHGYAVSAGNHAAEAARLHSRHVGQK